MNLSDRLLLYRVICAKTPFKRNFVGHLLILQTCFQKNILYFADDLIG